MLCCVVTGALFALLFAKLRNVPVLGHWVRHREKLALDASNWRLNAANLKREKSS
ncbi:MAG: hypothetical protein ACU84Q_17240 [Gammaproteobacteria bacterium]